MLIKIVCDGRPLHAITLHGNGEIYMEMEIEMEKIFYGDGI